jgi:hypothetical protein
MAGSAAATSPADAPGQRAAGPVTGEGGHCSFRGATRGPFAKVEGLFTVWICIPCLEVARPNPTPASACTIPAPIRP